MEIIQALESIPNEMNISDGDYIKNDVLMCGKCNTPKQVKHQMLGITKKIYCMCQCETEKYHKLVEENKERERQDEISRRRSICFKGTTMSEWTFKNDDSPNSKIGIIARKYVENFDKMKGLIFCGSVGTGKTFYASCIANALIDEGKKCLVTNFATLVNEMQGMFEGRQEYINSLNGYSLLVIDDLAAERNTDYMNEIVWNVIDARYRIGKPLIVTTNLSPKDLNATEDIAKQRIYSRILEMCIPVVVEGEDRRKTKMRKNCNDMKEILGL